MVFYMLCLMLKINIVIRIYKGLWFVGGKLLKKYKLYV